MGKSFAGGQNALLDYLKSLDASAIQELTACNDDVLEAINSFIQRMLGAPCLSLLLQLLYLTTQVRNVRLAAKRVRPDCLKNKRRSVVRLRPSCIVHLNVLLLLLLLLPPGGSDD